MPFDGVAVVRGKLVMEIVISLTKSDESGDDMIARRIAVVKWLVT